MKRHGILSHILLFLAGVFYIVAGLILSINVYAKQRSVFFAADGNPISHEVLLKLSSGTTKTEKRETVSVENTKSTEIAVPNNKKTSVYSST